jgi:hypothetical protein
MIVPGELGTPTTLPRQIEHAFDQHRNLTTPKMGATPGLMVCSTRPDTVATMARTVTRTPERSALDAAMARWRVGGVNTRVVIHQRRMEHLGEQAVGAVAWQCSTARAASVVTG